MGRRSNGEGSIAQRRDGRRQAAYVVGGKRHYMYGKTRKEVAGRLGETLAESGGAYYPISRLRTTWAGGLMIRSRSP